MSDTRMVGWRSPAQIASPPTLSRWLAIDFAMKGITVAIHLCSQAGIPTIADKLVRIHEEARLERDRS